MSKSVSSRFGARRAAEFPPETIPPETVRRGDGAAIEPAMSKTARGTYVDAALRDLYENRRDRNANGALALDAFGAASPRPSTAATETFRTLALTVDTLLSEASLRSVAVLSASPRDGRSLTADLLARGLSELRPPVRLLDADPFDEPKPPALARPTTQRVVDLNDASTSASDYARLPLASEAFANHREFLAAVRALLTLETSGGATVVIDVPACTTSSVGFAVAAMASAAIYVARTGTEVSTVHAETRAVLDLLGVQLLGVVFNEN